MGKKHKRKDKHPGKQLIPELGLEQLVAQLNEILVYPASGSGRKALELARLLLKSPEYSPAGCDKLIAAAYEMRFVEMLDQEHARDAALSFNDILKQHPVWAAGFSAKFIVRLEIESGSASFLGRYGTDEKFTIAIDEYLYHNLTDIRVLLRNRGLDEKSPPKAAAAAIVRAWNELEGHTEEREAFEFMKSIIRRDSPLRNWRLFLQALAAFYSGHDSEALKNLGHIPPDSPLRGMTEMLACLINNKFPENSSGRELKRLFEGNSLHGALEELLRRCSNRFGNREAVDIRNFLDRDELKGCDGLKSEILAFFLELMSKNKAPREVAEKMLHLPYSKSAVLKVEASYGEYPENEWRNFIIAARLSPLEKALALRELASVHGDDDDDDDDDDDIPSLMDIFKNGPGDRKYEDSERYWRESIETLPLASTYKRWFEDAELAGMSSAHLNKLLDEWKEACPGDATPLILIVEHALDDERLARAGTAFAELEKLNGRTPKTEELRADLYLELALHQLHKGSFCEALEQLEKKPLFQDAAMEHCWAALRWGCMKIVRENCQETPAGPVSFFAALFAHAGVWGVAEKTRLLNALPGKYDWPIGVRQLERIEHEKLSENLNEALPRLLRPADILEQRAAPSELLALLTACVESDWGFENADTSELLWAVTAMGLKAGDFRAQDFLIVRAALYAKLSGTKTESKKIKTGRECALLASEINHNSRNSRTDDNDFFIYEELREEVNAALGVTWNSKFVSSARQAQILWEQAAIVSSAQAEAACAVLSGLKQKNGEKDGKKNKKDQGYQPSLL